MTRAGVGRVQTTVVRLMARPRPAAERLAAAGWNQQVGRVVRLCPVCRSVVELTS
jgi:hypothetical protein